MAICELSEQVRQLIAAGQVVQRPASAVKELIENSIDAAANKITLELEDGGIKRIRITDNGIGIDKDDIPKTILPHATSKVSEVHDLDAIHTLGFRGEALASIAAVSRFTLQSAVADADSGYEIVTSGKNIEALCKPVAHLPGTTITVDDVFFNTPVQRRFLKSPNTEYRHIVTLFERLCCSYYSIAFTLRHQGRTIYDLPIATTDKEKRQRLQKVLGDEFATNAYKLDYEVDGISISGYVAPPALNRSQRDRQWVYVNNRFVRDKMLFSAILQAYRDVMQPGRHSQVVLYINCDPAIIDVNIHPTKEEIRFADQNLIFKTITQAIKSVLNKPLQNVVPEPARDSVVDTKEVKIAAADISTNNGSLEKREPFVADVALAAPKVQQPLEFAAVIDELSKPQETYKVVAATEETDFPVSAAKEPQQDYFLGTAVAQVHGIYVIAQTKDDLVIVDMHAGHERILYEKLKRQYVANNLSVQQLLVPIVIDCDADEMRIFASFKDSFNELGFDISVVGDKSLCLRAMPSLLKQAEAATLIHDALSDLAAHGEIGSVTERVEAVLGTIGCHSAIRANRRLSIDEMNALLREMEQTEKSGSCNHGRPTYWKIPVSSLDKKFSRGS